MKHNRLITLLSLLVVMRIGFAEAREDDPRLDDDFIRASLIMVSPGERVYQGFGHAAIRMECPSEGLDYVFTFESNVGANLVKEFVLGMDAGFIAVESDEFINDMKAEGRGLTAYRLNLTPRQRQELWRILDGRLTVEIYNLNIRRMNCLSTLFDVIDEATGGGQLYIEDSQIAGLTNGEYFERLLGRDSPWGELMFKSLYGSDSDEVDTPLVRTSPVSFELEYDKFMLGSQRLVDDPQILAATDYKKKSEIITPMLISVIISVILLVSVLLILTRKGLRIGIILARVGLVCVALVGLIEMGLTLFPWRIGSACSVTYVILNPVVIALLIIFRHKYTALFYTLTVWGILCLVYATFGRLITSEAVDALGVLALSAGLWSLGSAVALRRRR